MLAIGDVKAVAVEVGEHPFVGIEAVTVGEFHAVVKEAELGQRAAVPLIAESTWSQRLCSLQMRAISRTDQLRWKKSYPLSANEARRQACLVVSLDLTGWGVGSRAKF